MRSVVYGLRGAWWYGGGWWTTLYYEAADAGNKHTPRREAPVSLYSLQVCEERRGEAARALDYAERLRAREQQQH